MRSVLAVCRDEAAFRSVFFHKKRNLEDLLIASDDLQVHESAKRYADTQVVYFDQMEPYFNVVPHVLEVLGAVNDWLREQSDDCNLPAELLYWIQHVEGGETTQRIQDAILEARSCFALLDRFQPLKVIIGAGSRSYWEDEILIACAEQRNVPVQKLTSFNLKRIALDLRQRLMPLAKEIYRSVMTIESIYRREKSGVGSKIFGRYVAIQLCSPAVKHLNHTLPLLKAFEHQGFNAVAVTCDVQRTAKTLRKQGYKVAELEAWVSARVMLRSWWAAFDGLRRVKTSLSKFLPPDAGGEYAPLIRSALLPSVRSFFISEIPYRIRLNEACKAFFTRNPPVAARLWTRIMEQGVIAYRAMAMIGVRPLLFWNTGWPYHIYWPYLRYDVPADLIFCLNDVQRERLHAEGGSDGEITVSSVQWFHGIKEFASQNTPSHSRASLGITPQAKLVVFCDAQVVFRGYCSAAEQSLLVQAVIDFAERHTDVCVLIKPHIGHKPGRLEAMFSDRGMGRVIWIPDKVLPYHGLNASHVVLTKVSTLAAEAMILGVPSICVLLDQDMRWAIYEDAVDYALSIAELNEKLEALRDAQYYASYVRALRQRQIDHLERYFPEQAIEGNEFAAHKVKSALIKANR